MSAFTSETTTSRARKSHRCDWCFGQIELGETYMHYRGVMDSRWFTSKWHPECLKDCEESGEHEFTPGEGTRPTA